MVENGEKSEWGNVTSGILQGSVLSLIFSLYINDLPDRVESSILLFAADTKMYAQITAIEDQVLLQSDIDNMNQRLNLVTKFSLR